MFGLKPETLPLHGFKNLESVTQRNFAVLFLSGLLFWASLTTLLPTLPLYLQSIGATPQEVGIIIGAFGIGLLVFRFLLGYAADRQRKAVLVLGLVAVTVAPLGYWLTDSLPILLGVRIFHGLSVAAFTTGYIALVTDLAPTAVRGEILGYMTLVNPVGMAIGPALGAWVQDSAGNTSLFWVSVAIGAMGLGCACQVEDTTQQILKPRRPDPGITAEPAGDRPRVSTPDSSNRFWQLLLIPAIYIPSLMLLFLGLAFGTFNTFLSLFIKTLGLEMNAGLIFTAAALGSFLIRVVTGPASDRYGRGLFISLGLLSYGVSMGILFVAHHPWQLLGAGILEGVGFGMLVATLAALMADRSRPQERARSLNFCFIGLDLGIAISGPLLGTLANNGDYRPVFGVVAVLPLMALLLFMTCGCAGLGRSFRFALGLGEDSYRLP